ncbi:MAG TPA: hypothetical protein VFV28_04560 [Limnobacter sp.]|nr:hypothetical protein [Limnobacter sp.]
MFLINQGFTGQKGAVLMIVVNPKSCLADLQSGLQPHQLGKFGMMMQMNLNALPTFEASKLLAFRHQ